MAQSAPALEHQPKSFRQSLQRRSSRRIAMRAVIDAVAVSSAFLISSVIRFEFMKGAPAAKWDYATITLVATPVWLLLFYLYGLYEPRQVLGPVNEFKQVFHGVVAGTVVLFTADSAFNLNLARGWALLSMASGLVVVGGERLAVRKTLHMLRRRGGDATRTIIVGANHEARTVARTLERERWLGYDVVGFVDDDAVVGQEISGGRQVIGATKELNDLIAMHNAALVLVAATAFDATRLNRLFWELQDNDVDLQITSGTIDLMASRMTVQSVAGIPLIYVRRTGMDRAQRALKRSIDVLASLAGLTVLFPFLVAIAAWIRSDSDGGVFFKQTRVGRDLELFTCWKFRTMVVDAEEKRPELEHLSEGPGLLFKLKEDPRVTKAGRFLRRYSLDELPQLWNVLKGEMSLVGPRPALPEEVEQFDDWARNRLKVKPGMTGLWQVSGRTETSFSEYIRYDLFYIQNWSLSLDMWILWRTLRAVTSGEGAH
jgi:exopolysaccharide biosynthesis polyprenyl glycosylphosphotransferase